MFIYTYKLILCTLNLLKIPDVPGSQIAGNGLNAKLSPGQATCVYQQSTYRVEFYLQKNCHIPRTCTVKIKTTDNTFTTKFLGIPIEFDMKCTNTSYTSK